MCAHMYCYVTIHWVHILQSRRPGDLRLLAGGQAAHLMLPSQVAADEMMNGMLKMTPMLNHAIGRAGNIL
jgi:hypothetical protein